jgi:hypothetical protein
VLSVCGGCSGQRSSGEGGVTAAQYVLRSLKMTWFGPWVRLMGSFMAVARQGLVGWW